MGKNDSESKPLLSKDNGGNSNNGSNTRMYTYCSIVLLGAFSVGTMLGLSSPVIPDIQHDRSNNTPHLNAVEASWFGGTLMIGGISGGIIAGYIMQAIGRKYTSVISSLPYLVGLAFIAFATKTWMLYVGRIISGFGVGISSLIVPVYIGEVSTAGLRGMLGSGTQLCIVSGILLIYGLGIVLPWRWLCASAAVLPALLLFFSIFIVETPRYLMMKNKRQMARIALQRLRGEHANIDDEYQTLEASLSNEVKSATWKEIITQKELRTPTLLSLAAMYFQQLSGINCVMFYAKPLFLTAGFTNPSELILALLSTAGAQVLFTLLSCIIIDKSGRKSLLIIGGIFMTISLVLFGTYFQLVNNQATPANYTTATPITTPAAMATSPVSTIPNHKPIPNLTWMALVSMVVFIAFYSIGIGPVAWLLVGEIIPVRARQNAAGLSTAFNLLLVFILTSLFDSMLRTLTPQGTFWFFAANSAVSILFFIFILPETKGKTLEEIEKYFQEH